MDTATLLHRLTQARNKRSFAEIDQVLRDLESFLIQYQGSDTEALHLQIADLATRVTQADDALDTLRGRIRKARMKRLNKDMA